jgi:hypothetical protein
MEGWKIQLTGIYLMMISGGIVFLKKHTAVHHGKNQIE